MPFIFDELRIRVSSVKEALEYLRKGFDQAGYKNIEKIRFEKYKYKGYLDFNRTLECKVNNEYQEHEFVKLMYQYMAPGVKPLLSLKIPISEFYLPLAINVLQQKFRKKD